MFMLCVDVVMFVLSVALLTNRLRKHCKDWVIIGVDVVFVIVWVAFFVVDMLKLLGKL
jgi:hypothetical protein